MESETFEVVTQDSKNIALMTWIGTIFFGFIPCLILSNSENEYGNRSMRETRRTVKGISIGQRLAVAVVAACALTGCLPVERQITDAINETIKEKTCFALQEKRVPNWPMKIQRPLGVMSEKPLDPILAAMSAAGFLQITQEIQQQGLFPVTVDVITPTEKAKGWWDVQEGFCVGTKAVADVQEWTEPGKDSGAPIQVQFTWHLVDVPSWANQAEFKDIPGMTTPVPGMKVLQKTNKGWKAVF